MKSTILPAIFCVLCLPATALLLTLSGCGAGLLSTSSADSLQSSNVQQVAGTVFGAQQPIGGGQAYLLQVGTGAYGAPATVLATAATDANGGFAFGNVACPASGSQLQYIIGVGGNPGFNVFGPGSTGRGSTVNSAYSNPNLVLGVALPPCTSSKTNVNINELSTVALGYALAQFFTPSYAPPGIGPAGAAGQTPLAIGASTAVDAIGGPGGSGLSNGFTSSIPTLINIGSGAINANTTGSAGSIGNIPPSITIESAKINTIANALAACVNSIGQSGTNDTSSPCGRLFTATTFSTYSYNNTSGVTTTTVHRPGDTLQATVAMAINPTLNNSTSTTSNGPVNLNTIATLGGPNPPYNPMLFGLGDTTIAVSYSTTSFHLTVPTLDLAGTQTTPSSMDIDSAGNIWLPTSPTSSIGISTVGTANLVVNNGVPFFRGPYNTTGVTAIQGTPTLAIDTAGLVWLGDSAADHFGDFSTFTPPSGATSDPRISQLTGSVYAVTINSSDNVYLPSNAGTAASTSPAIFLPQSSGNATGTTAPTYPVTGFAENEAGEAYLATVGGPGTFLVHAAETTAAGDGVWESYLSYQSNTHFTQNFSYPTPAFPAGGSGGMVQMNGAILNVNDHGDGHDVMMTVPKYNQACSYNGLCIGAAPNFGSLRSRGNTNTVALNAPQGIAVDGAGYLWIANSGNASVSSAPGSGAVTQYGADTLTGGSTGTFVHDVVHSGAATLFHPQAIAIDLTGNVWITNQTASTLGSPYILTELIGAAAPTICPLANQGPNVATRP